MSYKKYLEETMYDENRIWNDFVTSFIYENRFFPIRKNEALNCIDKIIPFLKDTVDAADLWYRAREYEVDDTPIPNDVYDSFSDEEKKELERKNAEAILLIGMRAYDSFEKKKEIFESLSEDIGKKTDSTIWGFSKKDSGIPPAKVAGLNRVSPRYIPYLYLSSDSNTALAEVRAIPSKYYSVAKYRIKNKLNIVNFGSTGELRRQCDLTDEQIDFVASVSCAFSTPSHGNEKDYLVSQYIAEYIKAYRYGGKNGIDFDGIAYSSTRDRRGYNLVLFYENSCEFIGSTIHEITSIQIESRQLLPPVPEEKSE